MALPVVAPEAEPEALAVPEPAPEPVPEPAAEPLDEPEPPGRLTGREGVLTPVTEGTETGTEGVAETVTGRETDGVAETVGTVTGTEARRPWEVTQAQRAWALPRTFANWVPQADCTGPTIEPAIALKLVHWHSKLLMAHPSAAPADARYPKAQGGMAAADGWHADSTALRVTEDGA